MNYECFVWEEVLDTNNVVMWLNVCVYISIMAILE